MLHMAVVPYLIEIHCFLQMKILREVRELLKESDKVLKLVIKLMSFVFLHTFVFCLCSAVLP